MAGGYNRIRSRRVPMDRMAGILHLASVVFHKLGRVMQADPPAPDVPVAADKADAAETKKYRHGRERCGGGGRRLHRGRRCGGLHGNRGLYINSRCLGLLQEHVTAAIAGTGLPAFY